MTVLHLDTARQRRAPDRSPWGTPYPPPADSVERARDTAFLLAAIGERDLADRVWLLAMPGGPIAKAVAGEVPR